MPRSVVTAAIVENPFRSVTLPERITGTRMVSLKPGILDLSSGLTDTSHAAPPSFLQFLPGPTVTINAPGVPMLQFRAVHRTVSVPPLTTRYWHSVITEPFGSSKTE